MLRSALQSFGTLHAHPPLALPGQRIGLMGGTFNPPHEGHLVCAETALRRLKLDALWWIVTPGNPLKSASGLPSLERRMTANLTGFDRNAGASAGRTRNFTGTQNSGLLRRQLDVAPVPLKRGLQPLG